MSKAMEPADVSSAKASTRVYGSHGLPSMRHPHGTESCWRAGEDLRGPHACGSSSTGSSIAGAPGGSMASGTSARTFQSLRTEPEPEAPLSHLSPNTVGSYREERGPSSLGSSWAGLSASLEAMPGGASFAEYRPFLDPIPTSAESLAPPRVSYSSLHRQVSLTAVPSASSSPSHPAPPLLRPSSPTLQQVTAEASPQSPGTQRRTHGTVRSSSHAELHGVMLVQVPSPPAPPPHLIASVRHVGQPTLAQSPSGSRLTPAHRVVVPVQVLR